MILYNEKTGWYALKQNSNLREIEVIGRGNSMIPILKNKEVCLIKKSFG